MASRPRSPTRPSTTITDATKMSSQWTMRRVPPGPFGSRARRLRVAAALFDTRQQQYNKRDRSTSRSMTNVVVVLTTVPDDGRTDELARVLVEERLAACVNVHGPMSSTYRWRDAVQRDAERQL